MADNSTTEQIVREAPDIEAYKVGLLGSAKSLVDTANENALAGNYLTPDYEVAGMSPDQLAALEMGRQGIGAYQPYLGAATTALNTGTGTLNEALGVMRGADTRDQFAGARTALGKMSGSADLVTKGLPLIDEGATGLRNAQTMVNNSLNMPGFAKGIGTLYNAADQAKGIASNFGPAALASAASFTGPGNVSSQQISPESVASIQAARSNYAPTLREFSMGPAQQVGTTSVTDNNNLQRYMSPYQQAVTEIAMREANRQSLIDAQARNAQAARSGAFGGSGTAIQQSEAARNLAQLRSDIQVKGLESAYNNAMNQFNVEQQMGLAAQQANQQAGLTVGQQNLNAQLAVQQLGTQAGLQVAMANLSNEQQAAVQNAANRLQAQGMNQNSALQAALANQQAEMETAKQNALLRQQTGLANQAAQNQQMLTKAQLGLQATQQLAAAGTGEIGAQAQEAGLRQSAATTAGNLAAQTAGLANIYGNLGSQQANIYNQQATTTGNLASQQFDIGARMAQGIGALGTQQANLGMQQAALGQTAQTLGQSDVNMLYNLGTAQQKQLQAELDAQRQNTLQQNMQPYQQLGFLSDIYKGAPSSSMGVTTSAAPTASPFMQGAGLVIGGTAAATAAAKAGVI